MSPARLSVTLHPPKLRLRLCLLARDSSGSFGFQEPFTLLGSPPAVGDQPGNDACRGEREESEPAGDQDTGALRGLDRLSLGGGRLRDDSVEPGCCCCGAGEERLALRKSFDRAFNGEPAAELTAHERIGGSEDAGKLGRLALGVGADQTGEREELGQRTGAPPTRVLGGGGVPRFPGQ
jgi:hypothetical protein